MALKAGLYLLLLALAASPRPASATAGEDTDFSWMTLNGITHAVAVLQGVTPDLESFGLDAPKLKAQLDERLVAVGLTAVSFEEARSLPGAAQIKLRIVANRDANGFYSFGVKLEVRRKVPLGNPAGGFVSQLVWTEGESGMMQFNEGARILAAADHLLASFARDYRLQNSSLTH